MKNNHPFPSVYPCFSFPGIQPKGINTIVLVMLLLLAQASHLLGQNALRDIPSPDPKLQMDMFQLAEGFEVNLFASEPDVVKPIQMNWDAEGRLWVVSSTAYPHLRPGESANDKIIVLRSYPMRMNWATCAASIHTKSFLTEGWITPQRCIPCPGMEEVYVARHVHSKRYFTFKQIPIGDGKSGCKGKKNSFRVLEPVIPIILHP